MNDAVCRGGIKVSKKSFFLSSFLGLGLALSLSSCGGGGSSSSGLKTLVEQGKIGFAFENVILKYRALFEEIDGRLIDKTEKALSP